MNTKWPAYIHLHLNLYFLKSIKSINRSKCIYIAQLYSWVKVFSSTQTWEDSEVMTWKWEGRERERWGRVGKSARPTLGPHRLPAHIWMSPINITFEVCSTVGLTIYFKATKTTYFNIIKSSMLNHLRYMSRPATRYLLLLTTTTAVTSDTFLHCLRW